MATRTRAAVMVGTVGAVAVAVATAASAALTISIEGSPNDGGQHNALRAISATLGTAPIAVGEYNDGEYGYEDARTLALQWTGSSWRQMQSGNEGSQGNELHGVAVVSPTSAFAVGRFYSGASYHTLAESFDGKSWSIRYSPTITPHNNLLAAVSAASAANAWAVGDYFNGTIRSHRTLIEHFDGTRWSIVASPNVGNGNNFLSAVAMVPGTQGAQAWAVGSYAAHGLTWPLVERLFEGSWRVVSAPNGGSAGGALHGVVAVSRTAAFAVGSQSTRIGPVTVLRTLVMRWGGAAWHVVPSGNLGLHGNVLTAVTALTRSSVVAVGRYSTGLNYQTLVERLQRGVFVRVASPNPTPFNNYLLGVAAIGGPRIWAVGSYYSGTADRTLIEQMCPTC